MSDYSIKELEQWNRRIEELARESGLSYYDQEFELVSYENMTAYEAYAGMPSHYPHWSFGKAYERIRTLNKYNLTGLPYEMVINSNPCVAYLMKDNSLLLQILTMAHVYGHNDFFRNNRLFKMGTKADYTVEMFKNHAARIRGYISDPSIGYSRVEKVIDAAHALRYQCARTVGTRRLDYGEIRNRLKSRENSQENDFPLLCPPRHTEIPEQELKRIPPEPEEDILFFVGTYGRLSEWEKDIIDIIREETLYFLPQIETKIMNEGWASYWHYKLLNRLELPQQLYFEFLRRHNQVIKPFEGSINPYFLGFRILESIEKNNPDNPGKIFEARELERDGSFIRRYLTKELCSELNLYEYEKDGNEYIVSEVADDEGWMKIRDTIAEAAGLGNIPVIRVTDWNQQDRTLLLEHVHDGRDLELQYANETLKHVVDLWDGRVMLNTVVEDRKRTILCDEQKKIVLINT
ncbi:MAG TPA: SpoVR family protein [Clostridia bacterium]|nr:SpoVR family protein [Clostridia bacterium]